LVTTVRIITLGCKVNYTDSEEIGVSLSNRGYRVIGGFSPADLSIVNTCVVTGRADYQSRQAIRRAAKASPGAPIIVTGCAASAYRLRVKDETSVAAVVPPGRTGTFGDIVASLVGPADTTPAPPTRAARTRAFLKIQEGCDARCAYCIVPAARGPVRSLPPKTVLSNIEGLAGRGFLEVVLVGTHLGKYGGDLGNGTTLAGLLDEIAASGSPPRLRLSSVEPMELTEALLSVMERYPAVAPHLHVPLQSGDDEILRAMGRPYDVRTFERVVRDAAAKLSDPGLGVDVIVGLPGEGEREFARTVELIGRLPISYLHVFPFSRRPGTPAFSMDRQVPGGIKKERARLLRELGGRKKGEYINRYIGRRVNVLVEESTDGIVRGKSENYIEVYLDGGPGDINRLVPVVIDRPFRDGAYGKRYD
jgi:threonylcarbamoyladenosine tRNA methylthiotransferase MtaB